MANVLLKFGLRLVVVVDDDSKFMSIFTQMCTLLNIRLHKATTCNYKGIGVERFHCFFNHSDTLVNHRRETQTYFVRLNIRRQDYAYSTSNSLN